MSVSTSEGSETGSAATDSPALSPLDGRLARWSAQPKAISYVATAVVILIGWVWISFITAGVAYYDRSSLGPGMLFIQDWLEPVASWAKSSPVLDQILRLCTPQAFPDLSIGTFSVVAMMWLAMSIAMMLPSAAPMLRTYGDIAQVARTKGEKTVSLMVLAFGYLSVWVAFSMLASSLQIALVSLGSTTGPTVPIVGGVGGLILMLAGLYQFSSIKDACLTKCRNPFNTLFAQWSNRPIGVFKLGLEQGVFCVGCCWALMLVMLVVGTMNLAWMAFFTLFAIVEKSGKGKVTSHVAGGILVVWGGILILLSTGIA